MNDIRWLNSHIIDLTKTPWDKEKSNPVKGEFVFTGTKVYYKQRGYDSPWKVGFFIRYAPPYSELTMAEAMMGISPVKAVDCLAIPEGVRPNAEGYYQVGDVILAKEAKIDFLKRRKASVEKGESGAKSVKDAFSNEVEGQTGLKAEIYDL